MFTDEPLALLHAIEPLDGGAAVGAIEPLDGAAAAASLNPRPRSSAAATTLATLACIAALWWGQRFLVPVVAGLMLAMVLGPTVVRGASALHNLLVATVLALVLFVVTLAGAAYAFGGQLLRVADRVPEMISLAANNLGENPMAGDSLFTRVRDALRDLDRVVSPLTGARAKSNAPARPGSQTTGTRPGQAATRGAVGAPEPTPISDGATLALKETAMTGSSVLLKFAIDLTIILFVAFFVLAGGPALSHRFLDQWGGNPQSRVQAGQALRECARQVRVYIGVLLVTNVTFGLLVWGLFALVGLPDSAGWGVAAGVLHVVPYLGIAVLTGLGAAESYLAHGTWGSALGMAIVLVLISTLVGTLVTAWLQSRAAKMNAAAVFIGLVFWGALWGAWGLFLGPALVVVFKVIAEHTRSGQRMARLLQG